MFYCYITLYHLSTYYCEGALPSGETCPFEAPLFHCAALISIMFTSAAVTNLHQQLSAQGVVVVVGENL